MQNSLWKRPELVFTASSLLELTAALDDGQTFFITDDSQQEKLQKLPLLRVIDSNCTRNIEAIMAVSGKAARYVGVGGCAALDVARACAHVADRPLLLIPTFLSTSCISVDRSVLKYEGKFRASKTRAPETVFILDEFLETADNPTVLRAARAGFGDFFAGISAAIDYSFQRGNFSRSEIEELAAFYFNAVDWVLNRFNGFNRMAMRRLARYSHASSLMVIKRGNTELSAGGEHKLYYAIMESHLYNGALKPFHGELVAAGSLMNVWAFARQTGSYDLLKKFRTMCAHLGLPVDLAGLEQIGLSCADMVAGLVHIESSGSLLAVTAREISPESFVRKVFDEQSE